MSIAHKVAYNIIFSGGAKVLSIGLSLFSIGLLTRYLGVEDFGRYSIMLTTFAFFVAIGEGGFYATTTRWIAQKDIDEVEVLSRIFTFRLVTAVGVLGSIILLAVVSSFDATTIYTTILAAVAFFFSVGYGFANGLFQKHLVTDRVALAEFMGKIVQFLVILTVVYLDLGFFAVATTIVFSMATNALLVHIFMRRFVRLRWVWDPGFFRQFFLQAYPLGIATIVVFFYSKIDPLLLKVLQDNAAVGIYTAGYKTIETLIFFPAMVVGLILPMLARDVHTDQPQFQKTLSNTLRFFVLLIMPIVISTQFLAEFIIGIIGGAEFLAAAGVLRILIFALSCIFLGNLFTNTLIAAGKQKQLTMMLAGIVVVHIAGAVVLMKTYSYIGAAVMAVITEGLVVALSAYLVYRYTGYKASVERLWQIVLAGLAMAGVFLAAPLNLFVTTVCALSAYGVILWLTKAVTYEEITQFLPQRLQR